MSALLAQSLAGLPKLPCMLLSAPAEVLSPEQCSDRCSPTCSVQQTQDGPDILRVINSRSCFFSSGNRKKFSGNRSQATLGFVIPIYVCMSCQNGAGKCAASSSSNKQPLKSQQKPLLFWRNAAVSRSALLPQLLLLPKVYRLLNV